jgi:3-oxoacyl-[acyl-carrier-protein] synthase II
MTTAREVVITGLGVVSPIGIGRTAFADSLRAGRSGVRAIGLLEHTPFPVRIGGQVSDFDGKAYVTPRKSLKVMCREVQFAVAAALLAVRDAGLNPDQLDADRTGVVFGSELMYTAPDEMIDAFRHCLVDGEFVFSRWGDKAINHLYPLWMLKYLPNMPACHIAIALDARGPNNTFTLGDVSSLLALAEATRCVQRGQSDVMIVGGTGSRLNTTNLIFAGGVGLSRRNDDPAAACRPFDAARDGVVNGEGSGAFIVEDSRHAAARGAKVLARILGFGSSFEPVSPRHPRTGRSVRSSIEQALREAGISAADVGHVNANGRSTPHDDAMEAHAIRDTLGDTPVTAPKSLFGSLGAGTGAVEMAASLLALEQHEIPVTRNYDLPDPRCPINVVHGRPLASSQPTAVVINQSSTGQAVAAVLAAS